LEASRRVDEYLRTKAELRTNDLRLRLLYDAETMLSLITSLRSLRDARPEEAAPESAALYSWLSATKGRLGRLDEKDYYLGEIALISGGACRLLGKRDESELWLDRADSCFRHTLNPGPLLAMTA